MRRVLTLAGALALAAAAGCGTEVPATNRYDPETPPEQQAPATIEGRVHLESGLPLSGDAEVLVTQAVAQGGAALSYPASLAAGGAFTVRVPTGTYNVSFADTGYLTQYANGVTVGPGERRSLGVVTLPIARGGLRGLVDLEDGGSPLGTAVAFVPLSNPAAPTRTTLAGPDGSYFLGDLMAGEYLVRAEKESYAPAYTAGDSSPGVRQSGAIVVTPNSVGDVPGLTLYPASAIVQVQGPTGEINPRQTRALQNRVLLLAFVEFLTEMRVSEDPLFADAQWDVAYRQFNAQIDFDLEDRDGTHVIYAQFKDSFGLESAVFSTQIILDRQAPQVTAFTLNNGAPFLTSADGSGTAAMSFSGQDLLSGVEAYRTTLAASFGDEPYELLDTPGAAFSLTRSVVLGDADGQKTLLLELRDRAGNVSTAATAGIFRDKTPPLLGVPALAIAPDELTPSGAVRTLEVTLIFDVAPDRPAETLAMAVANGPGLDQSSFFVPFTSPYHHRLAEGPDGAGRQVCALFRDQAGLFTEQQCIAVSVDRTGGLTGEARLEGAALHSGILVEIGHPSQPQLAIASTLAVDDPQDPEGALYTLNGVPAGAGYVLRFSAVNGGYSPIVQTDVVVLAGIVSERPAISLPVPRSSIFGRLRYADKADGQHAGIVVADRNSALTTVTGPNGYFELAGLPVTRTLPYDWTASAPGYVPLSFTNCRTFEAPMYPPCDLVDALVQTQEGDFRICAGTDDELCGGGAVSFTRSRTVLLELNSTTATHYRVSPTGSFAPADPWSPFIDDAPQYFTFALAEVDGPKVLHVELSDDGATAAGPALTGVVTLDTTPPEPAAVDAVLIDADDDGVDAEHNNHPAGQVTLSLAATDDHAGVATVLIANAEPLAAPDFTSVAPVPYRATVTHNLDIGLQGERWVFVQFCDAIGNCTDPLTSPGDSIRYDTVSPSALTGATLEVNGGATVTNSPFVTVTITTGDAIAVRFGNTETLSGADFVSVDPGGTIELQHLLPLGDGPKTVYAQFVDAAGNESPVTPNPNAYTLELDTAPPTGAALALAASFTRADLVDATLTAAEATQYILHVGDAEDFSGESWQPFTGTAPSWAIAVTRSFPGAPIADGTYGVFVRFADAAGNVTSTLSRSITRDTVAPEFPSVDILDGDYSQDNNVNVSLFALGASDMVLALDGVIDTEAYAAYAPAANVNVVPDGSGMATVAVRFRDRAGNESGVVSDTILVDELEPDGVTFAIQEAPLTQRTSVILSIAAAGATEMRLANNNTFTGAAWEPYATVRAWSLLPVDGPKTVYMQLRDAADNRTAAFAATTTLDTTAPGSLTVDVAGGAAVVSTSQVTVNLGATDTNGVAYVMLANDPAYSNAVWEAYTTARASWPLAPGDGVKTVYVKFQDGAGNVSEKADSIVVDSSPPTGSFAIAGGAAAVTSSASVPLTLSVSSDVTHYALVEGSGASCPAPAAITQAYASGASVTHTFAGTPADGALYLTACFKDGAGLIGSAADSVLLDTQDPSANLSINGGGSSFTGSAVVTLTITATDATSGVAAIRLANTSNMSGVPWEQPTSPRTWTLSTPGTDGLKTMWLEVMDVAGRVRTNVSASVTLDTAPPTGSLAINGGATTQTTGITLAVTRGDTNTTQMAVAQGFLDCNGATYGAFAASPGLTLTGGDGLKTVSLCLKDLAGNTAGYSAQVSLDTQNPNGSLAIDGGAAYSSTGTVTLNLSADPDVVSMKIANSAAAAMSCSSGTFVTYATPYPSWPLAATQGTQDVSVCLRDAAGRTTVISDAITVDTVDPALAVVTGVKTGVVIDGDAATTRRTLVTLSFAATDATSGVGELKISDGATCAGGTWQGYATSLSWNVQPGDNVGRDVSVQFRDRAGRVSSCATDAITIDTTPSTVTLFAVDGGGVNGDYTNDASVSIVNLTFVGSCSQIQVSEDPSFTSGVTSYPCGQTWPATYTLTSYAADGSRDGEKLLYARVRDPAGNDSDPVQDSVILDTGGPSNGAVIINAGAASTSSLSLSLSLTAANATEMKISTNATCSGGAWAPYAATSPLVHPGPGPTLDVSVQFRDASNNPSGCASDSIGYDAGWTGGGAISISPVSGANGYTTSTQVTLSLTAGEAGAGVEMKLSNGAGCSGGSWEPFGATSPASKSWSLASGGEASQTVSVIYRDGTGNPSGCYAATIDVDTVAPSGLSVVVDSGAAYSTSNTRQVSLSITGTGMTDVRINEDPTFGGGTQSWQATGGANPYTPTFILSTGNGAKRVYVQFKDAAGNVASALASDDIILDNIRPTGTMSIDAGANYSTSGTGAVTLYLSASDNLSGVVDVRYRTSTDASTWSAYTTVPIQPTIAITLAAPVASQDGALRHVEVDFGDGAGNRSLTATDAITLDNVAPTAPTISINSGASYTSSQAVSLALSASGAPSTMQLSNGQGCTGGGDFVTYAVTVASWSLDGVGDNVQKYVSARFRDAAGNISSCASDDIYIDNAAPVAQFVSIENGAVGSRNNSLALNIVYSGTATQRFIANSEAGLASATPQDPATAATYDASAAPQGTLTLYVRFRDAAGNTSNTVVDTIIRDTVGPSVGSVLIDGGASYVSATNAQVGLTLSAIDAYSPVTQMKIRNGSAGAYTTVPFAQSHSGWTVGTTSPPGENDVIKTVEVVFVDSLGNESATFSDTIRLDNVAPGATSIGLSSLAGNTSVTSNTTVLVAVNGAFGTPVSMRLSNNNSCAGGATYAYSASTLWTVATTGDEGTSADVSVTLYDAAGNPSSCLIDSIGVDTVPPELSYLSLDGSYDNLGNLIGSNSQATKDCYLRIWGGYVSGNYANVEFSMSASFNPVFQSVSKAAIDAANTGTYYNALQMPSSGTGTVLCTPDGYKTVYFRAKDAAGNVSGTAQFTVFKDTTPPTFASSAATSINGGATHVGSNTLALSINASDNHGVYWAYFDGDNAGNDDDVCTAATGSSYWYGSSWSYPYTFPTATSGTKKVYVCLQDGAGNTTADDNVETTTVLGDWDSIVLDADAPASVNLMVRATSTSPSTFDNGTAGSLTCNSDGSPANPHWLNNPAVTVTVAATDAASGLSEMLIGEDTDLSGGVDFDQYDWMAYALAGSFVLSAGDGPKMLGLKVKDKVGNVTTLDNGVCVTLDTTPPDYLTASIAQGQFSASTTIDVSLSASDHQSSSTGMFMCFTSNTDIDVNGIKKADGITTIGSKSSSTTCNTSSGWFAFESPIKLQLTAGSGLRDVEVYVRDAAGNKIATPALAQTYLDTSAPTQPTLNVAEAGNKSVRLYWSPGADAESGLSHYTIRYQRIYPTPVGPLVEFDIDPSLTQYDVTPADDVPSGEELQNRKRYSFWLGATNQAGLPATPSFSGPKDATVGFERSNVAFSSSTSLIPFGVAEYGGAIYVGYLQYDVAWGLSNSTLHMAVSTDGGKSWRTSTIDATQEINRETAAMYVGPSGAVVVGSSNFRLCAWRSVDQGVSWTLQDGNSGNPYLDGTNMTGLAGVALTAQGGALVAVYERATDNDMYVVRSYDGGRTWTAPYLTYAKATEADAISACNAQFNVEWLYREGNTLYPMISSDLGATSIVDDCPNPTDCIISSVNHAAIACNDPTVSSLYGKVYMVFTNTGSTLYLRSKPYSGYVGYWDSSSKILATGVDVRGRPAIYAGGTSSTEKVFVAYRTTSGDLWLGESSTPATETSYSWTIVDKAGDVGVNLVINGTGEGSPILAYTDDTAQSLYVLRTALPAPATRAATGDGEISIAWSEVDGAANYQLGYGATLLATPDTNFYNDTALGVQTFEVMGLDAYGQTGEPGMKWEVNRFTASQVDSATLTAGASSTTGAMIVNGSEIFTLLPIGVATTYGSTTTECDSSNDVCVYRSTDGGASFTGQLVRNMTGVKMAQHMAWGANSAGGNRLYVVYTDDENDAQATPQYDPDLEIAYADSSSSYATWTTVADIDALNTNLSGDSNGEQVQISVSGAYVFVVWVQESNSSAAPTTEYRNIRYRYNTNYGTAGYWSARHYVNATDTDVDIGYTPNDLTIVRHDGNDNIMLAWTNGSLQVQTAYISDLAAGSWSFQSISGAYDDVVFMRGVKHQNNYTIAWIGDQNSGDSGHENVWIYLSGIGGYSAPASDWATVRLDGEVAIDNSLSLVQDETGTYVVYATTKELFGITQRQLKLAYCKQECAGRDNWHISILKADTDAELDDFGGALIGINSSNDDLIVGAGWEPVGTNRYLIEWGGRINRTR